MKTIAYMFVGAALAFSGVVLAFIVCKIILCRHHDDRQKTEPLDNNFEPGSTMSSSYVSSFRMQERARVYSFNQVNFISEGFTNRIADGSTYLVFKGTLTNGMEVAIKRMRENLVSVAAEVAKFQLQVDLLYRAQHQHIVNLIGYCDRTPHLMLLCQYAPNGSLFHMLHEENKNEPRLNWRQRLRIAIGIANGLRYLHHSCNPPIIHGDLTSADVLLTQDFAAKISGIGKEAINAHPKSDLQKVDNLGFKSSGEDQQVKQQSVEANPADDVYSFGIILLELLSGRKVHSEESGNLVDWAMPFLTNKEETMGLMDSSVKNVHSLEFHCICNIARQCVESDRNNRPAMTDVMDMILNFKFQSTALMQQPRHVKAPKITRVAPYQGPEFTPWFETERSTERPLGIDHVILNKSKIVPAGNQDWSPPAAAKIDPAFIPRLAIELPPGIGAAPNTFSEVPIA
ncbi:unnamed protein product [Calypogeia fissa]